MKDATIDAKSRSGYNVSTMSKILAKLVKDGNSMAVRLPKAALEMSGLSGTVSLEAKKGVIILSRVKHPREGWAERFQKITPEELKADKKEFKAWDNTLADGLEDIPYDKA